MLKAFHLFIIFGIFVWVNGKPEMISESFVGSNFSDEQGWFVNGESNPNKPIITECEGEKLFGGFNKFGKLAVASKSFPLPPHHSLKILVEIWKIHSWDNEEFQIWVDDKLVWNRRFKIKDGELKKFEGKQVYAQNLDLTIDVKHDAPTAIVVFTSTLNQAASDEAWAFRDFQLFVEKCPDSCSSCSQGETEEQCKIWEVAHGTWLNSLSAKISPEGWTVTGGNAVSTTCGPIGLFGGHQQTGRKTIIKRNFELPPHYRIKTKMMMAKISCWNQNTLFLKLNDQVIWSGKYAYNGYHNQICGWEREKQCFTYFIRAHVESAHSGPLAQYEISTNLQHDHQNESFGVRDFIIYIAKCAKNCDECTGPKPIDCKKCSNNWIVQDGECKPLANFILLNKAFTENQFTGIDGWTFTKTNKNDKISQCGGLSIMGGYGVVVRGTIIKKTFKIPEHTRLRLVVTVYKFDSWDNEWFYVKLDEVTIWKAQWNRQTGNGNFCAGKWPDAKYHLDEILTHKSDEAEISFTSNIDDLHGTDESWGFRDFSLYYEAKQQCAILYTECNYKGASFEFCSKSPNFANDNIPSVIRSVRIPPQGKVTLYENTDFEGKKIVFTKDQPCIEELNFQFVQVHESENNWIKIEGL